MAKFKVIIEETLMNVVNVEAKNGFDAVDEVRKRYHSGEFEGDSELSFVDFKVEGPLVKPNKKSEDSA